MCQEAILTWFRSILGISYGTTFLDLSNGIIVGKLLNQFKPYIFKEQDFQETNFVMNFARISTIVKNMLIYDNTLEPVNPLKIAEANDDWETIKFVYNTIKIIMDWTLAKEELNKLRRDQIQYIYDFIEREQKISESHELLKKIIEFEQICANQERQLEDRLQTIRQLEQQCEKFSQEKAKLENDVNNFKLQLIQCQIQSKGNEFEETLSYLKQNNIDLKQKNQTLEDEILMLKMQLEQLKQYENKCRDLENEILIQKSYYGKDIIDELQQKNKILKEQVKNLDDCSRAQKENSYSSFERSRDHQQEIQYQLEIQELSNTISKLQEKIKSLEKSEQFQMTPKPPKPKNIYLSDQKPKNTTQNEEKLLRQNQLLRNIINNLEIQSIHNSFRRKSLNG